MQVGFIGTGSMGSILIEAFMKSKSLLPSQVHASNRTFEKVKELAKKYTGLHAYPSNVRVAQKADILFLCVKPLEFKKVIDDIAPYTHKEQYIVSITSPVELKDLEHFLTSKIAKIIPSITNSALSGSSLMVPGSRLNDNDKHMLFELMKTISHPVWIDEEFTRVSSDIVSCGPAFISYILQHMIDAAVEETGIPKEKATALTSQMVIGLGELFAQNMYSLETLQERVCVPGGVTGAGLASIEKDIQGLFNHVFQATHKKLHEDQQAIETMFYENKPHK